MPRTKSQACAQLIGALLLHELQNSLEKKEKRKRRWVKKWIRRRNLYGASNTWLKELGDISE
jgi:type II secretory pathway component PulL